MTTTFIKSFREQLSTARKAVIFSHNNPDGDALGSSLAMYHYLLLKSIEPVIVLPNDYPSFLNWMVTDEKIIIGSHKKFEEIELIIKNSDFLIGVDFNAPKRVHHLETILRGAIITKVLIDHHIDPDEDTFDLVFSHINTSSTAELIFDVIDAMGDRDLINKKIAENIYVGMITDTGSFSYSCNNSKTYLVIASLVDKGVDCALIQRMVYNNFSENRMRLFGLCLSTNLYVFPEYKTAFIVLSLSDLKKFSYTPGDTEGIVNYAMAIKGIECAALFIERKDLIRISLRSFGNLSVNLIARTIFDGGGHKNAAGANGYASLQETVDTFKSVLPRLSDFYIE